MGDWSNVDSALDQIIELAASLKGHVGNVKGHYSGLISQRDDDIRKVHTDVEALQQQLEHSSRLNVEERNRLAAQLSSAEAEQQRKVQEYDAQVRQALADREVMEREKEAARGDAATEKKRLAALLGDLEDDALSYHRLRPSKPLLGQEDVAVLRQLFLSSAAEDTKKLSFSELKQVLQKYTDAMPDGALKKLFLLVENDTKGRMSYITVIGVTNDLVALIGDFRKLDLNGDNKLSRHEFREHFHKLGFDRKDVIDCIFRYADEEETDEVTFHEYVHLCLSLLVLRILFTFADDDKSGALTKDEVQHLVADAAVPAHAIHKFDHYFSIADHKDSGHLTYVDFVNMILLMFSDDA